MVQVSDVPIFAVEIQKMTESDRIPETIRACPIYEPGRPIETVARELGLDPRGIVKLASNENPNGPSPKSVAAIQKAASALHDYPDGGCYELRRNLAERHNVQPDQILPGNGSNEVLEMLATTYLQPGDSAVFGEQAFIVYRLATLHAKAQCIAVPMPGLKHDLPAMRKAIRKNTKLVFLASPDNPTGSTASNEELYDFVDSLPDDVLFCMDEAYSEYLDNPPDFRSRMEAGKRMICVRTFSKIFGLAGMRLGYAYGPREIMDNLNRVRQPFNVSLLAQAGAIAGLDDREHLEKSRRTNREEMTRMLPVLRELGITVKETQANFILIQVPSGKECFQDLLAQGVIVRPLAPYGLADWIRVTVGTKAQVDRFLEVFQDWYSQKTMGSIP